MKHGIAAVAGLLMLSGCGAPRLDIRPLGAALSAASPAERAYREGKAELAAGRTGLAIVAFENALANDPGSVQALNALGAAYDGLRRYDVAQGFYRRALKLEPDSADIVNNMAVSLRLAGDPDASRWFARAARLDPKNAVIGANVGLAEADPATARDPAAIVASDEAPAAPDDRPRIERASALEYQVVIPSEHPTDLGRMVAPTAAGSVASMQPPISVPPLHGAAAEPTAATVFDRSLLVCAPNVAPATLNAIIRTESGGNPLALHVNGSEEQPPPARYPAEAARIVARYVERGYNVDVGLMQVNTRNLAASGHTVVQALDPCTNVLHGSTILATDYARAARARGGDGEALLAALSAYNTGDFYRGFANGYVAQVLSGGAAAGPRRRDGTDRGAPRMTVVERGKAVDPNWRARPLRREIDRLEGTANLPDAAGSMAARAF